MRHWPAHRPRVLTEDQRRELLECARLRNELSDKALSRRFGVTPRQISKQLEYARERLRSEPAWI